MKRISIVTGLIFSGLLALGSLGCTAAPTEGTGSRTDSTAPPAPASPSTTAPTPASNLANEVPITLPVLGAFFTDDTFAPELKKRLQLTDAQINKLRAIAHNETTKLREDGSANQQSSTSAASDRAVSQITTVIGEEKTQQLIAFVRERWGGDLANAIAQTPNAVPSDTRVVVNAPAYRMDVFDNGQLIKSYRIGIGQPEFPLPTGLRMARTIIFNPTWTPPDEPWVEESNKYKVGEKVPAGSKLNPLGLIKIPIGLPSLIHGGKAPAKLGGFASHGCVGLTNAQVQEFSKYLAQVGGAEITDEQINQYAKNRTNTKHVVLDSSIPVELRYETIVVEDGKLHIYRDVYDRQTNTEANLRRVLQAHGVSLDQLTAEERAQVMAALEEMASRTQAKTAKQAESATKKAKPAPRKSGKEVVIELAALQGKGYPAAVALNTGQPNKQVARANKQREQ